MLRIFLIFCISIISGCLPSLANDDDRREQILGQILEFIESEDTITAINLYKTNLTLLHDGSLFESLARYYYGFILYKNNELIEAQEEINISCTIIDDYIDLIFNPEISDISESQIFAFPYYYRALLSEYLDNDETVFMFEKARAIFDLAQLTYTEAYLYILSSIIKYSEYEKLNKYHEIKRKAIEDWHNENYVSAKKNLKTCLSILDNFKYTLNREYGIIYQALGHISSIQNNLRDSELYFKQGLLYLEPYSILGGGLHDLCISLYLDLSSTYGQLRDTKNAHIILERAYDLCKLYGINNRDYLGIIVNLALLDNDNSKNKLEKILDEISMSSELNFNDRASFFLNLALSYAQTEDRDKYLEYLNKADEMIQQGDDQTLNSKIKFAIGLERFEKGDYNGTQLNLLEAKKGLNVNSGLAEVNFLYACTLYALGERRLIKEIEKSTHEFKKDVLTNFSFLSEQQRFSLWESINSLLKGYNGLLHAKAKSAGKFHKYYSEIYNNVLFSKGLLLNASNLIKGQFNNSFGESLKRMTLSMKGESISDSIDTIPYNPFNSDEEIEKSFLRDNLSVSMLEHNIIIHWKDIQKKLHEGQVAIEFVQMPLLNSNFTFEDIEYVAIVLRPEFKRPQAVTLFNQEAFIDIFEENIDQLSYSKSFCKLIWGNLEKVLIDCKEIFFSADGLLHQVAIENLPDYAEETLISDRYNLYRLSSTKEVLTNKTENSLKEAVLFGGIRYNNDILTMESESRKYGNRIARGDLYLLNTEDSTINSNRAGISFLPFTLKETVTIDSILSVNNYASRLMSGVEASEESLKNLSGQKKSIIHIATHGFYWQDNEEDKERRNYLINLISGNEPKNSEDLALTRTGLLMSGAFNILSGKTLPDGIDDGILTAMEISNIDLKGLDLVVLSACQSGKGDYRPDGIFGLQRGFKKAGANSILMTLWNVDDEATQILMTEFYKNFLNGKSKRESLLAAQKAVRETPGFEDPEYWAAFILLDALN